MGESALEQEIENAITKKEEIDFLNKTSMLCNNSLIGPDVIDFYSDLYSEKRDNKFDEFSARFYALRKTYDYIFYGELLTDEMEKGKIREEIKKTKKGQQDINSLMKKYVDLHPEIEEKQKALEQLNLMFFNKFYHTKSKEKTRNWMISYLTKEVNKDE